MWLQLMKGYIIIIGSIIWISWFWLTPCECQPQQGPLRGIRTERKGSEDDNGGYNVVGDERDPWHHANNRVLQQEVQSMRDKLQVEYAKYYKSLTQNYGEKNVEKIFFLEDFPSNPGGDGRLSLGRAVFDSPGSLVSWPRLVRKMVIKLIEAQGQYQQSTTATSSSSSSTSSSNQQQPTLVWATGGHSVSAGHGNFFEESYTNVLDRQAKPIFAALGIHFQARVYGMSAVSSAFEMAACTQEIFGLDPDIVVHHYGSVDGPRHPDHAEYFSNRVARLPNRPAVIMVEPRNTEETANHLARRKMTALYMNMTTFGLQQMEFPDCGEMDDWQDMAQLPDLVRNFRCGNAIEKMGPLCGQDKFTLTGDPACDQRRYRMNWHPGWKWHAYMANIFTLFLLDIVRDALAVMESEGSGDLLVLAETLRQAEIQDSQEFLASTDYAHPDSLHQRDDISLDMLYKSPNYCFTARLPSEIRFQGILTGRSSGSRDEEGYDRGTELEESRVIQNPPHLPLTYDQQFQQTCKEKLQNDFNDFFLASGSYEDFVSLVVPTDAQIAAYGTHAVKGILAICLATCSGRCPANHVELTDYGKRLSIRVNGVDVASVSETFKCHYLQQADGSHIWEANEDGRFEIAVKVHNPQDYVRIGTIVVY